MKHKLIAIAILLAASLACLRAQEALPLGWHSTDIGSQDIPGSTTYDQEAELFTLESTGDQIFRPDNLHFAYAVQTGNFEIITLVSYLYGMGAMGYGFSPNEEAGVMIREDLSPFSNTYYMSVVGGQQSGIRYYVRNNGDLDKLRHPGEGASEMMVPCWLKLRRIGNSFESYYSVDGINWVFSPDASETIDMNATCYAGLFCRGNANYVDLFGWENPNNESILPALAEFEGTRIEEIENIYTVQDPINGHFVHVEADTSFVDVSSVFGRMPEDVVSYSLSSSDNKVCRPGVMDESDSVMVFPKGLGSCTFTLEGDVNSFNLVNKFPIFVWEAPQAWTSHDLGHPKYAGFALKERDLITIGGSADASGFELQEGKHYMHRSLEEDAEIVTRIDRTAFATSGSMGGICLRADSISQDALMARLVLLEDGDLRFEYRDQPLDTVLLQEAVPATAPVWIRMTKVGDQVQAFHSEDGRFWQELGSPLALDLGQNYEAGLMVGSSDNQNYAIANFSHLQLIHHKAAVNNPVADQRMTIGEDILLDVSGVFGHPEGAVPVILIENEDPAVVSAELGGNGLLSLSGLSEGESSITLYNEEGSEALSTMFTIRVFEPLGEEWLFSDIGMPFREGYAANLGEESYDIASFGTLIDGSADQFTYLHREVEGPMRIVAKVTGIEDRGAASQAGIMFRESTDPGSLYILYTLTAYEGIKLQYRWDDQSHPVIELSNPDMEAPCWLKLERDAFNYFTAFYSEDGSNWIPHAEFSIPLDLPESALAGLAVTSGFNEGTSSFEEVDISPVTGIAYPEELHFSVRHFPNPFTESVTLDLQMTESAELRISLFNAAGTQVAELVDRRLDPGRHQILLNLANLPNGTYYYRVVSPSGTLAKKIVKLR